MHSKEETPFPLRTIVSAILEPVAVTRRHRFRWVSTMSPTLISSMGFKCSEVNMRVPAGKHGEPPTTRSACPLYGFQSIFVISPRFGISG